MPAVGFRVTGRILLGAFLDTPVPLHMSRTQGGDAAPRDASLSAPHPSPVQVSLRSTPCLRTLPGPASTAGSSARGAADSTAGLPMGTGSAGDGVAPIAASLAPPPLPPADTGAAVQEDAAVFTFSASGNADGRRPVVPRGCGPSSTALWTLPLCQVTIRQREYGRFWREVKAKVEEMVDCAFAHRLLDCRDGFSGPADAAGDTVSGSVELTPSQASASVPVGPMGRDLAGAATLPGGCQAFLVLRGVTHNTYQPLSWKAKMELRDKVGQYGLGSVEVMQLL